MLIILGRPFLVILRALIDMEKGKIRFKMNNEEVTSNIYMTIKHQTYIKVVSIVNLIMKE